MPRDTVPDMNTTVRHISAQNKTAFTGARPLREGGFVFIRVVSDNGSGRYTVSLGGTRFEAVSDKPLAEGSVFRVQVALKDGRILLVPERSDTAGGAQGFLNATYRSADIRFGSADMPAYLSAVFSSLGLPADAVSLRLVSFLQQSGLSFNCARMIKARRIAASFPGRECEAAEVSLFLAEKGIEPDVESVAALLNTLCCGFSAAQPDADGGEKRSAGEDDDTGAVLFERLYGKKLTEAGGGEGVLTLANHLATAGLHWIVLPFEYDAQKIRVFGNIRILLDVRQKNTQKVILEAEHSSKKYFFVLYYNRNAISRIAFRMEPPPLPQAVRGYERMLSNLLLSINESSFAAGNASAAENVPEPDVAYDADAASGALFGGEPDQLTRICTEV